MRQELEQRTSAQRERQRMQALAEKSFYYLTEDEIRRMKEAVTKLAQRLKNVVADPPQARASGQVRRQATRCARTSSTAACPFRIQFDRKRKDKPQVVVLCDVSDSVRNVSRFMLQFVYSLQDLYSKVRSFIFVARHRRGDPALRGERHPTRRIEQALTRQRHQRLRALRLRPRVQDRSTATTSPR